MNVVRFVAPIVTAAVALSACGGHGGGAAITPAASGTTTTTGAARGSLALTIKIPHPSATSSTTRKSAYISASTQSLAMRITQGTTTVLQEGVALTPASNPNCATAGSTTTCTITAGLAAGTYTGTFATYDGPLVNGAATGNILSQGQSIPIAVTAGNTDTIAATLDGVPASITIAPASGSTITGTQSGGFTVPYSAQPLTIEALDADSNVILGAGAPAFTVTATSSKFSVTQPTANAPNTITLASAAGGTGTLSVTAAPPDAGFSCSASGVACTASASIASTPHTLYVANSNGISVYQSTDNITWTQTATQTYNPIFFSPNYITADANGNVFVSDAFDPYFDIFAPPYTASATQLTAGLESPNGMIVTPSDQLLVADTYNLNVYAPPFTGAPSPSQRVPGNYGTVNVVLDGANDALVLTGNALYQYPSPYTGTPATLATGTFNTIAIGGDGTLFLGAPDYYGPPEEVLVYAPPYTSAPIAITLPTQGGYEIPVALTVDSNGNLWVAAEYSGTCPCNNYLYEYAKPFSASSAPVFSQIYAWNTNEFAADNAGDIIIPTGANTLSIINEAGTTVGTITTGINYTTSIFYVK